MQAVYTVFVLPWSEWVWIVPPIVLAILVHGFIVRPRGSHKR